MFGEFYKCEKCDKVVEVVKECGGALFCCDRSMKKVIPNSIDVSHEKHVPVIEYIDKGVLVKVGVEPHPMIEAHYIEWIEISYGSRRERKYLKPGDTPEASFTVESKGVKALIYCNLHGLWISEK